MKDLALTIYWYKYAQRFYYKIKQSLGRATIIFKSNLQMVKLRLYSRVDVQSFMFYLYSNPRMQLKNLVDIAVIDRPGLIGRFKLNYIIFSPLYINYLIVQISTNEVLSVPSLFSPNTLVSGFFTSSNWLEREAWDMYGIYFKSHSDLRRILTDYGFSGHPLRRDFPLTGFIEVYYDDVNARLVGARVELAQEFRVFVL